MNNNLTLTDIAKSLADVRKYVGRAEKALTSLNVGYATNDVEVRAAALANLKIQMECVELRTENTRLRLELGDITDE